MTNKQKIKILLKAAELIAEGKEKFACHAIDSAWSDLCSYWSNNFITEFVEFYDKTSWGAWFNNFEPEDQNTRVLLLLTFAESLK